MPAGSFCHLNVSACKLIPFLVSISYVKRLSCCLSIFRKPTAPQAATRAHNPIRFRLPSSASAAA